MTPDIRVRWVRCITLQPQQWRRQTHTVGELIERFCRLYERRRHCVSRYLDLINSITDISGKVKHIGERARRKTLQVSISVYLVKLLLTYLLFLLFITCFISFFVIFHIFSFKMSFNKPGTLLLRNLSGLLYS